MYLQHFGLSTPPFSLSPKLDFLYESNAFAESMAHLIYGVDSGEALVMITGPIGTGKTTAIQSFLTNLGPQFATALVTNTRINDRELLKLVLDDLDADYPVGGDKSDLVIAFKRFLIEAKRSGRRVLVVVDEAQNLPAETLEEVRLLTNLGQGEEQPVQIVLVGQPELEAAVDAPELAQLRQRIRVHYRLEPLTRDELGKYLPHRMTVAGCPRADVFTAEAVGRIYEFSGGVPRVVNTLANDALLAAFVAGHDRVRGPDVERPQPRVVPAAPVPVAVPAAPVFRPVEVPPAAVPATEAAPQAPAPVAPAARISFAERAPRSSRGGAAGFAWGVAGALAVAAVFYALVLRPGADGAANRTGAEPDLRPAPGETATAQVRPPVVATPMTAGPDTVAVATAFRTAAADTVIPFLADAADSQAGAEAASTDSVVATLINEDAGEDGLWAVHVVSFRTIDRAESYVANLRTHSAAAYYKAADVDGVGWYRVFLGPFPSRAAALAEAHRLSAKGVRYYKIVEYDQAESR